MLSWGYLVDIKDFLGYGGCSVEEKKEEKKIVPILLRLEEDVVKRIDALVYALDLPSRNHAVTLMAISATRPRKAKITVKLPETNKVPA